MVNYKLCDMLSKSKSKASAHKWPEKNNDILIVYSDL